MPTNQPGPKLNLLNHLYCEKSEYYAKDKGGGNKCPIFLNIDSHKVLLVESHFVASEIINSVFCLDQMDSTWFQVFAFDEIVLIAGRER